MKSSRHSGNSIHCPRSASSTKRLIIPPQNHDRIITAAQRFHTARVILDLSDQFCLSVDGRLAAKADLTAGRELEWAHQPGRCGEREALAIQSKRRPKRLAWRTSACHTLVGGREIGRA